MTSSRTHTVVHRSTRLRRSRRRVGGAFGAVAVGVVVSWFVVAPWTASVNVDDGVYAVQAAAIEDGSLSIPHVLADVDAAGVSTPYANTVTDSGYYLLPHHSPWSAVLAGFTIVIGDLGVRVAPALAFAAAVVATYYLAHVCGCPRAAPLAAGLALASPMLFDALQLWAHTAVAAAIAVALLGSVRIMQVGLTWMSGLFVVSGCVVATLLRGDGFMFAVAVALALTWRGISGRRAVPASVGVAALVFSVLAYGSFTFAISRYVGGSSSASTAYVDRATSSRGTFAVEERLQAALSTLFTSARYGGAASTALLAVGAVFVLFAGVSLRRKDVGDAQGLLFAAAAVLLIRVVAFSETGVMATGILGGWPIVLLALGRRREHRSDPERFLILVVVLAVLGVLATQGEVGGGLNWGGRYISASVPALCVLVAVAVERIMQAYARRPKLMVAAVAAVAAVSVVGMLKLDWVTRQRNDRILAELDGFDVAAPIVTSHRSLPLLDWSAYPERQWLRVPSSDPAGGRRLASLLREAGIQRVVVYHLDVDALRGLAPTDIARISKDVLPETGTVQRPLLVELG